MRFDPIAWPQILGEIRARRGADGRADAATLNDAESLSALFVDDFVESSARICRAREADPFNPLHTLRLALLQLRFG
jgi:hypothetical protein